MRHATRLGLSSRLAPLTLALSLGACLPGRFLVRNVEVLTRPMLPPPHREPDPAKPDARLAALWVGHATVLLQIDDKFVLTDPVFTDSVGQLSRRLVAPGLEPERLPELEAVLVSHTHFDHLSLSSLRQLEGRAKRLFVPTGALVYVPNYAFPAAPLKRFASWASPDGLRITAVPVDHVGGRYGLESWMFDRAHTGYVISYHGYNVYFGGDTAYKKEFFEETRRRFPKIDLAILPIAPVNPRDFMRHTHMDPYEALLAFNDLGAERMMPIHFDTFINSTDREGEARERFEALVAQREALRGRVSVLAIGERRVFVPRQ
jgi:N-acyl-phosphatidylethanolamine-hydrolysing phospholipase D